MKPIRPSALDAKNLVIGPLADNDFVKSQRWATLFYEEPNKKLLLQTPHFLAETYGIPRADPYLPDAKSRAFFKLPFCHERMLFSDEVDYDAIAEWHEKLLELDQYLSGQEVRVKLFGEKSADKYECQPPCQSGMRSRRRGGRYQALSSALREGKARPQTRHRSPEVQALRCR